MMDQRYQVKQYVAVVKSKWCRFMVFKTGDEKWYLFSQLYEDTMIATGLQFPVKKSELRDDIRRALAHGWGNSS